MGELREFLLLVQSNCQCLDSICSLLSLKYVKCDVTVNCVM